MCLTPDSELAYKAMDETAEYAHELHAHVKPETRTRPMHLRIAMAVVRAQMLARDFAAFWAVGRVPAVLIALLCIAIVSMLAGWAYQELRMADWSPLLAVIGVAL